MERLFVLAVGLDSKQTAESCSAIYRAITRAHMFVCVIQEHIEGGWLEFTATVELDEGKDFDAKMEAQRVKRDNLEIIDNISIANEEEELQEGDEEELGFEQQFVDDAAVAKLARQADGATASSATLPDEESDSKKKTAKPVDAASPMKQSVWQANANAKQFSSVISSAAFTPFKQEPEDILEETFKPSGIASAMVPFSVAGASFVITPGSKRSQLQCGPVGGSTMVLVREPTCHCVCAQRVCACAHVCVLCVLCVTC
jgi:hypothetical protein